MSDPVPASVSTSLQSLTTARQAWPANTAATKALVPVSDAHVATAREMCGLLIHPAQSHAVMFVTACVSVIGVGMLCGIIFVTGRTVFRIGRWSLQRVRHQTPTS